MLSVSRVCVKHHLPSEERNRGRAAGGGGGGGGVGGGTHTHSHSTNTHTLHGDVIYNDIIPWRGAKGPDGLASSSELKGESKETVRERLVNTEEGSGH